ncbi:IclR family transcriptional regulator [Microbacterium sp. 1.5R]|uniref:IclR family transcriptional regulator n=1 Tax=Microbacterium sp. 1.5R TaxID=1916917 RepID=UPI00119EE3C6|nr:helix-turn-helix domain-containing protein [Microbacterium sp. 1.5R]
MPSTTPTNADDRGPIQSIDRAAAVLGLFDENTRALTTALVADRLGMNRSTAHRYLHALQTAGFLSPGNAPGPLIDQLAALVSSRQQVVALAPPILRRLADRVGLTAVLSFRAREGAVVTLVEEAPEGTILLTVRPGTVLELRAAQTRVLLAYHTEPSAVARALADLTPAEARLEQAELAKVRRDRLAWADLRRTGLESVAVPVFGGGNDAVATIALIGTTALLGGSAGEPRVEALRAAGEELTAALAL